MKPYLPPLAIVLFAVALASVFALMGDDATGVDIRGREKSPPSMVMADTVPLEDGEQGGERVATNVTAPVADEPANIEYVRALVRSIAEDPDDYRRQLHLIREVTFQPRSDTFVDRALCGTLPHYQRAVTGLTEAGEAVPSSLEQIINRVEGVCIPADRFVSDALSYSGLSLLHDVDGVMMEQHIERYGCDGILDDVTSYYDQLCTDYEIDEAACEAGTSGNRIVDTQRERIRALTERVAARCPAEASGQGSLPRSP